MLARRGLWALSLEYWPGLVRTCLLAKSCGQGKLLPN
jgi:hypothetical protein